MFTIAQALDFIFLNLFILFGVSVTSKREKIGAWKGEGIENMRYYSGLWSSKGHHIYINIYGRGCLVGKNISKNILCGLT